MSTNGLERSQTGARRRKTAAFSLPVFASLVLAAAISACGASATDTLGSEGSAGLPDTEPWARVLSLHHRDGGIDYAGLQSNRQDLDTYLAGLSNVSLKGAGREDRIAFWVNAYNAVVLHWVLEDYPDLPSVKDVSGFFDSRRYRVAGEDLTLDEIETHSRDLDPRVHFAVVCASTSCPDLRGEPYEASRIEEQLEEQTQLFLADPSKGLRFDSEANDLWLSSIFKWYADDFTGGSRVVAFFARGRVLEWVLPHLPGELAERIRSNPPSVRYLDYDWTLNDRPRS